MNIRVISWNNVKLVLEIEGEDHTLGNLLMKEALRHPGVKNASYRILHPLGNVIEFTILIREDADMSTVIREIIDSLRKQIMEFQEIVLKTVG